MLVCNVGELHVTAITNIGRMRDRPEVKKQRWVKVFQVFLSETLGG